MSFISKEERVVAKDLERKLSVLWRERDWAKCLAVVHEHVADWHFVTQAKREGFMLGIGFGLGSMFELNDPKNFLVFFEAITDEYRANGHVITLVSTGSSAEN